MKDKSVNYNHNFSYANHNHGLDHQRPNVDLSVGTRLQYNSSWSNRFLSVNLTGTNISADGVHNPPKMAHDDGNHRGWYTESVLVEMWLSDKSVFRKNDGPVTTGESVSVTSGTSTQVSANVGTMGGELMAGISGGISLSQSFSQSIPDFSISNNSDATKVSQLFRLSSSSAGSYHSPHNLEHHKGLDPLHLVGLPAKAKAGLAISSQAIFATPDGSFDKKVTLHVRLEHTLAKVWIGKYGFANLMRHTRSSSHKFQWQTQYEIDFADVS